MLKTLPIILLLAGCMSAPKAEPSSNPANPDQPASGQAFVTSHAPIILNNGPLTLTIYNPEDLSIQAEPTVVFQGNVSEEAVLTINNDIYTLSPGNFTQNVNLDQGLNALQIVCSDLSGNEVDIILTVTYQP